MEKSRSILHYKLGWCQTEASGLRHTAEHFLSQTRSAENDANERIDDTETSNRRLAGL